MLEKDFSLTLMTNNKLFYVNEALHVFGNISIVSLKKMGR